MQSYNVEVMSGDVVTSHQVAIAETPAKAATAVTGRAVHDWRQEMLWVRVTNQADRVVYKFAFR
ncbi:hypothetical protein EOA75_30350 [Mesorhizobium sp. M1A.F.Ca.IN.022.07.1.1]|uniref:hypothetical protein n=1 Tax=Mesorhizobium sp. M1A.F.Ca.IN.022.07.1.1 TaxID=2496767 RepID=UPI000FCBDD18|nr:hypothetical protein [Mesorhizobium sp. M1A.F.Ca.IN.022.07.1.1]RUV82478.1 hypothetical protein EOA75_30350 [Mesorhizobium sp. M1A.F.Ca.IN.022.07.1.1]